MPSAESKTPWSSLVATWPIPLRQRWADLAGAAEDSGTPWPDSEREAFRQVWRETTAADREAAILRNRWGKPVPPPPEPTWAELQWIFDVDIRPTWEAWCRANPKLANPPAMASVVSRPLSESRKPKSKPRRVAP